MEGLNEAQREAVTTTEGYVRVIAGAGSGKTRALTHRFAYLVNEAGILPGHILCVTFTNKSANEMRQRIHNLTGDQDTGYICTFHSFCVSVLQEDSYVVQYPKNFLVLDNSDIDAMLKIIYEERGLTLRHMTFSKARDMIEIRKLFEEPEYYLDLTAMSLEQLQDKYRRAVKPADMIFYGYLYQEKKCFGLDYNDLIKLSLYIFDQSPEVRLKWQKRLEYIMVDEFQDIDALQYQLMSVLCGYHHNLFLVGDPDQTIYTWRGANVRYLLDFHRNFSPVKDILMMQNYRSTPQILAAVNSLISKNQTRIPKDLEPTRPDGPPVTCYFGDSSKQEAEWMAGEILSLQESGVSLREVTVLYRAHYITRNLEEAFRKKEIPYAIYSGVPFFGRMEIKDALSYLRMIVYQDDLSFLRIANVPKRNLGERRMKFLQEYGEQNHCSLFEASRWNLDHEFFGNSRLREFVELVERFAAGSAGRPVSEVLSEVLNASGYEEMLRTEGSQERLDNLAELKQSVYEYETTCGEEVTLEHYLSHVALFTNQDIGEKGNAVKLMTVHSAKGLEFPCVFLCAMNEGVFPSQKTRTWDAMEEERRLAFVAMTRAERRLYLSQAGGWGFDGSPRYPSRFLLDIDQSLLSFVKPPREGLIAETRRYIAAGKRRLSGVPAPKGLAPGRRVRHRIFGEGTVQEVDREAGTCMVKFDELDTARQFSLSAPLEPV